MLKVFLIPMDVLQQKIILLTMKALKIKGYSKQDLKFKDFTLTQLRFKSFSYLYELYASSVVSQNNVKMT